MRPKLGLKPTTPQNDAGRITDAIVCEPMVSDDNPAATAAAEPLLDPPGVCAGLCGLRVGPGSKNANSVVTVLPSISAPASRSFFTQAASLPANNSGGSAEPAFVGKPSTQ